MRAFNKTTVNLNNLYSKALYARKETVIEKIKFSILRKKFNKLLFSTPKKLRQYRRIENIFN